MDEKTVSKILKELYDGKDIKYCDFQDNYSLIDTLAVRFKEEFKKKNPNFNEKKFRNDIGLDD